MYKYTHGQHAQGEVQLRRRHHVHDVTTADAYAFAADGACGADSCAMIQSRKHLLLLIFTKELNYQETDLDAITSF